MRKIAWLLLMFCGAICVLVVPAFGFCMQPHRSVACDFLNSDAVFTGTVISTQNTPAQGDEFDEGWTYEMSVQKMYRGPAEKQSRFSRKITAAYPLEFRKEYLIFASINRGRLEIFNCDDSAPLSEAKDIINQIEKIQIPKDAIVEGQVALHQISSDQGLAGVQISFAQKEKCIRRPLMIKGGFAFTSLRACTLHSQTPLLDIR
jgi:hypothetical protein